MLTGLCMTGEAFAGRRENWRHRTGRKKWMRTASEGRLKLSLAYDTAVDWSAVDGQAPMGAPQPDRMANVDTLEDFGAKGCDTDGIP